MHTFTLESHTLKTGDLICTTDGEGGSVKGRFWWLVSRLIPGEVDHVAVYVGPGGRCIEAGATGKVVAFHLPGPVWDAEKMVGERGPIIDLLKGVVSPIAAKKHPPPTEEFKRETVAAYCERQLGKPYNLNFLDSGTEKAFYCSQLAYKAYKKIGVNLNTNRSIPNIPGTESIVFPEEIWTWDKRLNGGKP